MWNSDLIKALRWIVYLPLLWFFYYALETGFIFLFEWFFNLSTFWFWVVLIFLAGAIWGAFKHYSLYGMLLLVRLCPHYKAGAIITSVCTGLWCLFTLLVVWGVFSVESSFSTFHRIIATLLVLGLSWSLILGSLMVGFNDGEELF